ncbi:MAG: glutamate-5-semialdehyde dehydrogenase [Nitrospinota bacterium]
MAEKNPWHAHVVEKAEEARRSTRRLATLSTAVKNAALHAMAQALVDQAPALLEANGKDLDQAEEKGLTKAMIDRLALTEGRIEEMATGLREVAALTDPVGEVLSMWRRPNGLEVGRVRVPLGVVGVIYESRPNVTADTAGLCLKSGNAVLLRGGSEAIHANTAIATIIREAAAAEGVPPGAIQFLEETDRAVVGAMLTLDRYIDVIIPRGGEGLIRAVTEASTIPVLKHDKGLVHIYIDADADHGMAEDIVLNAKTQRPGVYNVVETLLIHDAIAPTLLPSLLKALQERGVEIRGCPTTQALGDAVVAATEEDWDTEYLDLILAVKVVEGYDEAVSHIEQYGSRLTEAIITTNYTTAKRFLREVDSACVFVNASTRFTDGHQFGLGAEMGVSTSKLHVRGPVGLADLTSVKYIAFGDGQVRT